MASQTTVKALAGTLNRATHIGPTKKPIRILVNAPKATQYAPIIPAIAPLAPINGTFGAPVGSGMHQSGNDAPQNVKDQETDGAQTVFQRVHQGPQAEHIPDQVEQPTVQEHVRQQAQRLPVRQYGGDQAPIMDEAGGRQLSDSGRMRVKQQPQGVRQRGDVRYNQQKTDKRQLTIVEIVA